MLDAQEIAHRFLDTRLQVHPDVVRYILEQGEPDLIDRIIAGVPKDTIVVSAKHIPGIRPTRDGIRFHVEPEVEVVTGICRHFGRHERDRRLSPLLPRPLQPGSAA